jgi:hypothetical protein
MGGASSIKLLQFNKSHKLSMILDVQFSFKLHLCCYNFIDFHAIFRLCDVMVQMGFEFLFGNKGWMEFHVDGTNST